MRTWLLLLFLIISCHPLCVLFYFFVRLKRSSRSPCLHFGGFSRLQNHMRSLFSPFVVQIFFVDGDVILSHALLFFFMHAYASPPPSSTSSSLSFHISQNTLRVMLPSKRRTKKKRRKEKRKEYENVTIQHHHQQSLSRKNRCFYFIILAYIYEIFHFPKWSENAVPCGVGTHYGTTTEKTSQK